MSEIKKVKVSFMQNLCIRGLILTAVLKKNQNSFDERVLYICHN